MGDAVSKSFPLAPGLDIGLTSDLVPGAVLPQSRHRVVARVAK